MTISVDLGGGTQPRNPFKANKVINIDPQINSKDVVKCWLGMEKIPLEDSSVDYVTAYDLVEHIPRVLYIDGKVINPFIDMMSEVYRILKKGGIFYAMTPAYPKPQAFQDPTHVNIITDQTVSYFCEGSRLHWGQRYGFKGKFKLVEQKWEEGFKLVWRLKKL